MRKWRPPKVVADEEREIIYQTVVPSSYRLDILKLGHEAPMAGHLGVNKNS